MPKFVELWVYLSSTPLFGLTATLVVYILASRAYTALEQPPWANPVLWTVLALAGGLLASGIAYPVYFSGAQFIHFLLGPAVVALAWPLWQRRDVVRRNWGRLMVAALVGGTAASGSGVLLGWLMGLPHEAVLSLVPKSVTAPVAMGVAERIGGVPALSAAFAVLAGIIGAISAKYLYQLLRVPVSQDGWVARGFALGTASHGIGAARALQVNPEAGAFAGLALGLQVLLQALLIPLVFRWIG